MQVQCSQSDFIDSQQAVQHNPHSMLQQSSWPSSTRLRLRNNSTASHASDDHGGTASLPSPRFSENLRCGQENPGLRCTRCHSKNRPACRDPVYYPYPGGPMRKASRKGIEANNWSDDLQDHRINCLKRGNRIAAVCQPWLSSNSLKCSSPIASELKSSDVCILHYVSLPTCSPTFSHSLPTQRMSFCIVRTETKVRRPGSQGFAAKSLGWTYSDTCRTSALIQQCLLHSKKLTCLLLTAL